MAMIRIEIKSGDKWDFLLQEEMKSWCREKFGKNQRGKPQIWRSYYGGVSSFDGNGNYTSKCYFYFYFREEKHANWFGLKWL